MQSPLEPFLSANGFVILDGGLGTELEAQGADLSDHMWSAGLLANNPSLIRETHLAYYRAGADVVTSASYQASYEGFQRKGIDRVKATELLLLSVKLAVEARDQFWREYQQRKSLVRTREDGAHRNQTASTEDSKTPTTKKPIAEKESSTNHGDQPDRAKETAATSIAAARQIPVARGQVDALRSRPPSPSVALSRSCLDDANEPVRINDVGDEDRRLRPLVAASVGCYGAAQADGSEYRGDYGARIGLEGLKEWHRRRLDVLAAADGVDLLMFETIPCLEEVRAVLSWLEDFGPRVKAVISVSCKDDQHLRSGESLRDFASLIWKRQASRRPSYEEASTLPIGLVGIGVNCVSPTDITGALKVLSAFARSPSPQQGAAASTRPKLGTGKVTSDTGDEPVSTAALVPAVKSEGNIETPPTALVAYPNSGEKWDPVSRGWVPGTGLRERGAGVEDFGRLARKEWWQAGARVVGGCCRTRPSHVAELRRVLLEAARSARDPTS